MKQKKITSDRWRHLVLERHFLIRAALTQCVVISYALTQHTFVLDFDTPLNALPVVSALLESQLQRAPVAVQMFIFMTIINQRGNCSYLPF